MSGPEHAGSRRRGACVPRLDPAATLRLHDVVNAATLAWTPDMPEGRVRAYVEKHGAAHLLSADRVDDAGLITNLRGYWNLEGMQFGQNES